MKITLFLGVCAAAGMLAGCASDANRGGVYTDRDSYGTGWGYGAADDWRSPPSAGGVAQTNGPGMHSETRTGLPGPGTTGTPSRWDGGTRP